MTPTVAQVRREFEWPAGTPLRLSYADEDGDEVEASPSTDIHDLLADAKYLMCDRADQK